MENVFTINFPPTATEIKSKKPGEVIEIDSRPHRIVKNEDANEPGQGKVIRLTVEPTDQDEPQDDDPLAISRSSAA